MEKGKIRTGWFRNLNVRLGLVMAAVILPVNLLTVLITETVYRNYEQEMVDSYENQLNMYMENVSREFTDMQENVMQFLSEENLPLLTLSGVVDPMVAMTRIKREIEKQRGWISLPGLYYIQSHELGVISFLIRDQKYSQGQMEQMRAYLMQKEEDVLLSTQLECFAIEDTMFLVRNYVFPQFSFGILCDIRDVLAEFYEDYGSVRGSLYLTGSDGSILSGTEEGQFFQETEGRTLDELEESGKGYVFLKDFGDSGYQVAWVLARGDVLSELPVLIYILRGLALLSFTAFPLLYMAFAHMVTKPLFRLTKGMKTTEKNLDYRLTEQASTYQIEYIYYRFNHMLERIQLLIRESYEKEIERLKTDAVNMQLEVNQHLLLNFLNTIYSLSSAGKPEKVNEFTLLLMKYFRYVLREDSDLVPVREELQFVRDYLEIQHIRFPDRFASVYSVQEEAMGVRIPRLLIQNFVENAVKHGLDPEREIEILLNIRLEGERLYISVCDTGNGMTEETVERLNQGEIVEDSVGKHIGVWNCRRRLKLYYGEDYRLTVVSQRGEGTQVWIELPVAASRSRPSFLEIETSVEEKQQSVSSFLETEDSEKEKRE